MAADAQNSGDDVEAALLERDREWRASSLNADGILIEVSTISDPRAVARSP